MKWEVLKKYLSVCILSRGIFPNSSQQSFYILTSLPPTPSFLPTTSPQPSPSSPPSSYYQSSFPPFNRTRVLAHSLPRLPRPHRGITEGTDEKQAGGKQRDREGRWGEAGTGTTNLLRGRYMIIFAAVCNMKRPSSKQTKHGVTPPFGPHVFWKKMCRYMVRYFVCCYREQTPRIIV